MNIKRLISCLLAVTSVFSSFGIHTLAKGNNRFTEICVPCPDGEQLFNEDYLSFSHLLLRYKDDKTPIPLSCYSDGFMYATVPVENKSREVEYFISEDCVFPDENEESSYEFYIMKELASKGVITGRDDGTADPFANVTRAEATAIIMRFLGIYSQNSTNSGFTDVPEDAWYAGVVCAAKELGIVSGDSADTFSPQRNVSHEEMVSMCARALWCTGLQDETAATKEELLSKYKDAGDISDWALSAYGLLGYFVPIEVILDNDDLDAEGFPTDNYYTYPHKASSREEICETILRICDTMQWYPTQTAVKYGFNDKMPVIDGSTSTYPFTQAVYYSLFTNGFYNKNMPKSHSKSHISYERLINGEVDMIFASVYPSEDIKKLAKDKGVELELIPIAYDAMVFFTNAENPAENLTKQQISDIYVNNAYSNWKQIGGTDALLYPYCRNNDSGSHAQMEKHFLNGQEINEKIRKETTSYSMSNVLTDVMASQTDNPAGYGLGYSIYYYFRNMDEFYGTQTQLKLLSIDGVYPTDKTIADGTYPLSNNTYVVLRKDEPADSPSRKLAEFMLTEQGQQCVIDAGFGPLNPPEAAID